MALLKVEAAKLSNNELEMGVVEEIIIKEDLFSVLPFMGVNSKAYVYNRESQDSTVVAGLEGDFKDVGDVIDEAAAKFVTITTRLRILIGDVDVDKFLEATQSDTNDQKATQIAAKAKGLARKFKRSLLTGDSSVSANQFDGLAKIVHSLTAGYTDADGNAVAADATRTIFSDGSGVAAQPLTFTLLDKLLDAVPNGADVLFMPASVIRAYRVLLRNSGGLTAAEVMVPEFGRPMLTHNGVPILINDFIPLNESVAGAPTTTGSATSVYAVRLNEIDGLHAIYGGGTAGIVVEDVGTVQNKDATRTRLKWYCGLALKSTHSIARLRGLSNIV